MSPLVRRIAVIGAWVVFIMAAPILIIYSLGHKITPSSPIPIPVGNFSIRTSPSGATIFLDNKERSKTPTEIRSLLPGNYNIRIIKDGYRSWQKNLPIQGTFVTDIMHVKLIPEEIEKDITRGNVVDYSISPKEEWLAVTEKTTRGKQLRILKFSQFTETGNLSKLPISIQDKPTFLWSSNETYFVMTLKRGTVKKDYLVNVQTGEYELLNVKEILGWVPGEENRLVIKDKNKIVLTPTISSAALAPKTISETASAFSYGANGYLIAEKDEEEKTVLNEYYSNGDKKSSIPLPSEVSGIDSLAISPFGDIALATEPNREMFVWENDFRRWQQITEHAENIKWSPSGKQLLWSETEFDMWVMNLKEDRSPLPKTSPVLVGRFSKAIQNPDWYSDSQHLLFFQNDTLKMIEIDPRDGHLTEDLVGVNTGDSVSRCLGNGEIIFMNAKKDSEPVLLRIFLLTPEDRGLKISY